MRLDLYLKTSRLLKRRALARAMCDSGNVRVNGREARAAKEVKPGDSITLTFSTRRVEIEVLAIPAGQGRTVPREENYRVISDQRIENQDEIWIKDRASQ